MQSRQRDDRSMRVIELKALVERHAYVVDPQKVAEAMLRRLSVAPPDARGPVEPPGPARPAS